MRSAIFTFSLVSAVTLGLTYRPMLERMSFALVSPYPKADFTRRLLAIIVDGFVCASVLYRYSESWLYVAIAAGYLLLRDSISGRSIGKWFCGLVVIDLQTGRPCNWSASVRRNILLLLPGANMVAAFLEARTVMRDPQGLRLGDRFALTQVVDGFGARDLVDELQEALLNLLAHTGNSRKPREVNQLQ